MHILIWETGIDDIFSDVMIGLFRWKILMDSDMLRFYQNLFIVSEYKHLIIIHLYIYEIGGYIGSGKKVRTVKVT